MTFKRGQSGNPAGRRPGSKNKSTDLREKFKRDLPAINRKVIEAAKAGEAWAVQLIWSRCYPPLKPQQQRAPLPGDFSGDSLTDKGKAVIDSLAAGSISADDARQVLSALADIARLTEHTDFDERLKRLEAQR